ncbi:MAG: uridine diphosphate-N-acetylglucosamine-binding protein YvcK [Geodermatophilaceae bacterium]|nr:uridine diphosphate-N-acetylglucosamine-binding protein YvcK [Geodermatophilaceae bacterium]
MGGGHGLSASLAALRRLTGALTAVVTVADDGGSSGVIRRQLGTLPPGDLRMAVATLAGDGPDDARTAALFQHRFGGTGSLAGHPVGNLIITGLLEIFGQDPVAALAAAGRMVGMRGQVLPMSPLPLEIAALVAGMDPDHPEDVRRIRGQVAVATTPGRVVSVGLVPAIPSACPEAVEAILTADAVVLGPGSWFSSVLPHVLVPDLLAALVATDARIVVTLNLAPQPGETEDFSPQEHLDVLYRHAPGLAVDVVLADEAAVADRRGLTDTVHARGARLVLAPLAAVDGTPRHDPVLLAEALAPLVEARGDQARHVGDRAGDTVMDEAGGTTPWR